LRVGGGAEFFVLARSGDELAAGLAWALGRGVPVRVIGGGSNLLVAEAGVEGLVIKTANTQTRVEDRHGQPVLVAEAGATLAKVARSLAKLGFGGLEWAANVPGTVGGAAVNNAGAFGGDMASSVDSVTLVDASGNRRQLAADELDYAYRSSALKRRDQADVEVELGSSILKRREHGDVAVESVEVKLSRSTPAEADGLVKRFNAQRMQSQPRILSAGSVFANPVGTFAGRLIDQAGLKGTRVGGAEISDQHANFIVNPGAATARDVFTLMRQAQDVVYAQTGIWLRPEIELLGRWSPDELQALAGHSVLARG
jgi:UDP-N-acetylmuramate dehydrogenase